MQAKKNDSDCNFNNFSILVPYTNKFLVVCIFHGIYYPPTHEYFFCEGQFSFLCLVARGWKDSNFSEELLFWEDLISFLGECG